MCIVYACQLAFLDNLHLREGSFCFTTESVNVDNHDNMTNCGLNNDLQIAYSFVINSKMILLRCCWWWCCCWLTLLRISAFLSDWFTHSLHFECGSTNDKWKNALLLQWCINFSFPVCDATSTQPSTHCELTETEQYFARQKHFKNDNYVICYFILCEICIRRGIVCTQPNLLSNECVECDLYFLFSFLSLLCIFIEFFDDSILFESCCDGVMSLWMLL